MAAKSTGYKKVKEMIMKNAKNRGGGKKGINLYVSRN